MQHTTGLTENQIKSLCNSIRDAARAGLDVNWPPILGLSTAVRVTVTYLRRNRTQADLAETFGVSQPTISRAITGLVPILAAVLDDWVPVAEDLHPDTGYIIDGTLLPCWSWRSHPELYSGKHRTTGYNVQVAATLDGRLSWVSDPVDGCHHDSYALSHSGVLDDLDPADWVGDKGYLGHGMITPIRKPPGSELHESEKNFNTQINRIRWIIEQIIANLKTWRILHTDYRRPIKTFKTTISAVLGLHFYRLTE